MSVTLKIYNDIVNNNSSRKDGREEVAKSHGCITWGCNDLSPDYTRGPLTTLPGFKVSSI